MFDIFKKNIIYEDDDEFYLLIMTKYLYKLNFYSYFNNKMALIRQIKKYYYINT